MMKKPLPPWQIKKRLADAGERKPLPPDKTKFFITQRASGKRKPRLAQR